MSEYEVSRYLSGIGRRGGKRTAAKRTAAERSAIATKASHSRKIMLKPGPWFGLFDESDLDKPELVAYSQNKLELRQRAKQEKKRDWVIEVLDYNPNTRVKIKPEFKPDVQACLQALRGLEDLLKGRSK
jgi:hypothetical protein